MREVSFGQDGSYSAEAIVNRVNAELANSFGNLAQRTLSMIFKNLDGELTSDCPFDEDDRDLMSTVNDACRNLLPREFSRYAFSVGIEEWLRAVFACNQYVDKQAPWALRKTDPERMRAVLMTLFQAVRALAIAIHAVVPTSSDRLLDQLGIDADSRDFASLNDADWFASLAASGFRVSQPLPLFPRLELSEDEEAA
jgi:methionyl-tRNA synthetase